MPAKAIGLRTALFLCLCSSALMRADATPTKEKLPIPDAASLKKAVAIIRDTYQDDYRVSDKAALARMLVGKADESRSNPTDRFALLWEAQNVAAEAVQVALAVEVIDTMACEYALSPLEMKVDALEAAAGKARTAEQKKVVADAALEIVDEAIGENNFDAARTIVRQGSRLSRLQEIAARRKEVEATAKAYADAQEAMAILKENPDDPEANTIVGRYACLNKGNWEKGLPMLVKGSDERLKAVAAKDVAGAASTFEQVKLGDAWWDLAKERAGYWYGQALPGLSGLEKDRVEKRIATVSAMGSTTRTLPASLLDRCVLYYSFDKDSGKKITDKSRKSNDGKTQGGRWTREGVIGGGYDFDGKTSYISVPNDESLNFGQADFTYSFWLMPRRVDGRDQCLLGHVYNPEARLAQDGKICMIYHAGGQGHLASSTVLSVNRFCHIVVTRNKGTGYLYINGTLEATGNAAYDCSGDGPVLIGRHSVWPDHFFDGVLDEIMIWSRSLSENEVKQLYRLQGRNPGAATKEGVAEKPQGTKAYRIVPQNTLQIVVVERDAFNKTFSPKFPSSRNKAKGGNVEASSTHPGAQLPEKTLEGARTGDVWSLNGAEGTYVVTWAKPVEGRYILIFGRGSPKGWDPWGKATISVNSGKATPISGMAGQMDAIVDLGHRTLIQKIQIHMNGPNPYPGMAGLEIHDVMGK